MAPDPERAPDAPIERTTEQARAGATPHMTRYVLGFGLAAISVVFIILMMVWMRG